MRIERTDHGDIFVYNFREIDDRVGFDITRENRIVELDPCPFCGTNGRLSSTMADGYFGMCPVCLASGPRPTDKDDWIIAAYLWNSTTYLRHSDVATSKERTDYTQEEKEPMVQVNEKSETSTSTLTSTEATNLINVSTHCINCLNQPICKYSESYVECKSTLESLVLPEVVKLDMRCKYFKPAATTKTSPIGSREGGINTRGIQIKHTRINEESAGDEI